MADYIRRDIVLDIINTMNDTGGFAGYADYSTLFDEIDTMPAADVKRVKRGKWKYYKNNGIYDTYKCSICNTPFELPMDADISQSMHYCPDCGAKMSNE